MYTLPHQHTEQTEQIEALETLIQTPQAQDARSVEQARQAIERAASFPYSPPSVVNALQSDLPAERAQALQVTQGLLATLQMAALQKQGVDDMIALVLKETREARRQRQIQWVEGSLFVTFMIWLLYVTHQWGNAWWLFSGGGAWAADQTRNRRRATVSALGKAGDPRAVGALAVAARDGENSVQYAARQALLALLPRVKANHAAYITPDQMNALLELAFRSDAAMQIATLKALEQIGDQRAIPVVENLAISPHAAVREQAKQCLPFLNERARRAEQSATLLRGASVPSLTGNGRELLRPVGQTPDATPADQLLRPTGH